MGGLGCVSEFIVQPSDGSESRRELSLDAHAFIPPLIAFVFGQRALISTAGSSRLLLQVSVLQGEYLKPTPAWCAVLDGDRLGRTDGIPPR